jgi:dTDP-4-dehydrorhamnose reductase
MREAVQNGVDGQRRDGEGRGLSNGQETDPSVDRVNLTVPGLTEKSLRARQHERNGSKTRCLQIYLAPLTTCSVYILVSMRLLITGAGGMLGHDVQAAADELGHEASGLTRAELDIREPDAVMRAVAELKPEAVINCAAWTDVDGAEEHYDAALAINGVGAGNVGRAAAAAGAWTLHVSTDYVFDGTRSEPYLESDPTSPMSGYGRSKLEGEREVAAAAPGRHTIVRTSWLFGLSGACFPKTILKLAGDRERLSVVDDQVGCPTFTGHLGAALVALAAAAPPPGVLHVAASGQCSWFEFAREIVAGGGAHCEVSPCTTDEFPHPAHRPAYSVLRSERDDAPILPDWREGLREFQAGLEVAA